LIFIIFLSNLLIVPSQIDKTTAYDISITSQSDINPNYYAEHGFAWSGQFYITTSVGPSFNYVNMNYLNPDGTLNNTRTLPTVSNSGNGKLANAGNDVWVTYNRSIVYYDYETDQITDVIYYIPLGLTAPTGIALNGDLLWIGQSSTIHKYNLTSRSLQGSISLTEPTELYRSISFAQGRLWYLVKNNGVSKVYEIDPSSGLMKNIFTLSDCIDGAGIDVDGNLICVLGFKLRKYALILSANEDYDGDGLTNGEEETYKTNPRVNDTDGDG
jgi:hypothetical protein